MWESRCGQATNTHMQQFFPILQGFCVDLIEQISDQVGFKYIIELVPDNNYGALNLTSGKWNGLVKGNF